MTLILATLAAMSAHLVTVIDNTAVLLAAGTDARRGQALAAFVAVQLGVLVLAAALGETVADFFGSGLRWLGLVPVMLGVHTLLSPDKEQSPLSKGAGFAAWAAVFVALSTDSLAVLAALFADSAEAFDVAILAGALASIVLSTTLASIGGERLGALSARMGRLAPWAMIAAGVYVILDTGTDIG